MIFDALLWILLTGTRFVGHKGRQFELRIALSRTVTKHFYTIIRVSLAFMFRVSNLRVSNIPYAILWPATVLGKIVAPSAYRRHWEVQANSIKE
jgi:hypothetical protein